ncbi:hypothetical protein RE6C_03383 [Rhodopirellula europaea 6C]|uniref:Uncharacterized protein n=1 Tax=Rhodopirellula europaea 6C TaxID=1263867 RepID=M2A608_9BACT|nr:hypothetical protein RE6C_03383 [Rhodopirellula europaea 6C]
MQWVRVLSGDLVPRKFTRTRGRRNSNFFSNPFLFLAISLHDRDDNTLVKGKMCHS